jgi:NitT/TauT family transport system substrate-binding protein
VDALYDGKADVVVDTYSAALRFSNRPDPIINVGQIFAAPSMRLICRAQSGISELRDVVGRTVATGRPEDRLVVERMLRAVAGPQPAVRFVERGVSVAPLINGQVDCITGEIYNEYRQVFDRQDRAEDFTVFKPDDFGVASLEDGLYVRQSRLNDPQFVDRLAHLLKGLRRGWEDARAHPNEAVDIVLLKNPALDRADQAAMLEAVTDLLPAKDVLYLDPGSVERATVSGSSAPSSPLWTHAVWNRMLEIDGKSATFNRSTLYLAAQAEKSSWFFAVLMFGFCVYALAAVIDAVGNGYDLWGRLILSLVAVMGGGILRDLIFARSRLPFAFLEDPTVPVAILTVVMAYSLLLVVLPNIGNTNLMRTIRRYSEAVGFGIVTVYGALVCILAGAHWYWAPFAAAMTIAGGGIMRDVITNREPRNFRGAIFEEVGVVAGLLVVAVLLVANHFEHAAWLVYSMLAFVAAFIAVLQLLIGRYQIRYPRWLAQPKNP